MALDPARYEMINDQMAGILRGKTPIERLKMAESKQRMARGLIRDKLRYDHPDWTAGQARNARQGRDDASRREPVLDRPAVGLGSG